MPASKCDASIRATQVFGGTPCTFLRTSVQVRPPSRVTCMFPSSVPVQMTPACTGDSATVVMAPWCSAPELSRVSPPLRPMTIFSGSWVERSGEMAVQLSPPSVVFSRWFPPRYRSPGSWGDMTKGEAQLKRRLRRAVSAPMTSRQLVTFRAFGSVRMSR